MSLLIIDDDPEALRAMRVVLAATDFAEVHTAPDGPRAFQLLDLGRPTAFAARLRAVLLDLRLPGMDGLEVLRLIRGRPHLTHLPVIVLTGSTDEADLEAAFAAGATDFLTKPLTVPHLLARVRTVLKTHAELDWYRNRVRTLEEQTRFQQSALLTAKSEVGLDALTGLANRRSFDHILSREWNRAAREGVPLGLLMLDVDNFKAFNDLYGHPAGDACLARVADALRRVLHRAGDVAARYGGEEFAAVLPCTDARGCAAVGEAVRAAVEAVALTHAGSPAHGRVTVSVGAASAVPAYPGEEASLVWSADEALYRSKREGRNRVTAAPEAGAASGVATDLRWRSRILSGAFEDTLLKARETGRRISEQVTQLVDDPGPSRELGNS